MSTTIAHEQESKQQSSYNGKDDQKQQAALSKKQSKQTDAPVDAGSSLVGGTIAAVQHAVDRGINMLPASLQDRAHTLEEQAKLALHKAGEIAAPVVESYQHDGIIAAAKTAGHVTKETASAAASQLKKGSKKEDKAELKGDKKELKADLKAKKDDTKSDLKAKKDEISKDIKDAKEELSSELQAKKEQLTPELQAKKDELSADLKGKKEQLKDKKEQLTSELKDKKAELKSELKGAKADAKSELKGDKQQLKGKKQQTKQAAEGTLDNLQKSATDAALGLQASAIQLKDQAIAAGLNLKERVLPSGASAEQQADAPAPKKHGRRRRGGRGHGNRKMKTKLIERNQDESIMETLGDKANEIKDVVEERAAASSNSGIVQNIRSNVSNITTGITSTASGLASSASSTATGLVSGAQAKVAQLSGSAKQLLNESTKAAHLDRKPSLQRRDELPALGTPMSPDATITETRDGKLAAKPADQSSLLDKAKFAVGGVVEATRDFVADKLDNISMNADDNKPLEKKQDDKTALQQATKQLDNLKQAVSSKKE